MLQGIFIVIIFHHISHEPAARCSMYSLPQPLCIITSQERTRGGAALYIELCIALAVHGLVS